MNCRDVYSSVSEFNSEMPVTTIIDGRVGSRPEALSTAGLFSAGWGASAPASPGCKGRNSG
jgi:hypothetical protein